MKRKLQILGAAAAAALVAMATVLADAQKTASEGATAIDRRVVEIAAKPGEIEQMCSPIILPPTDYENAVLPFFGFSRTEAKISPKQFIELRGRRDEVIGLLRRDFARTTTQTLVSTREDYIYKSQLLMLLDLNGSEALEELIGAAERLSWTVPPPPSHPTGGWMVSGASKGFPRADAAALSTILALLYNERDPAVLHSEFAMAWEKGRKHFIEFTSVELTPERRAAILGWARDFVKRVPAQQRARAKNMAASPVAR